MNVVRARILAIASALVLAITIAPLAQAASTPGSGRHPALSAKGTRATTPSVELIASIFDTGSPALSGAGWRACPSPITWSVDTRALPSENAAAQVADLTWAFDQWAALTGLTFTYTGHEALDYDSRAQRLHPASDTTGAQRHIYVGFLNPSDERGFTGNVDGLASPTLVMPSTREIVQGQVLLRTDYFTAISSRSDLARAMDIHEIGHVLGLAHSPATTDIMYPMIARQVRPSARDVASARRFVQPCVA